MIQIYKDRVRLMENMRMAIKFIIAGVLIFLVFNYVLNFILSFIHLGGLSSIGLVIVIAGVFIIMRNLLVLRKPYIVLTDEGIKYFNLFFYSNKKWNRIGRVKYFTEDKVVQLERDNGSLIDKIDLEIISDEDVSRFLDYIRTKKNVIISEKLAATKHAKPPEF
jgi:hypothetical protein